MPRPRLPILHVDYETKFSDPDQRRARVDRDRNCALRKAFRSKYPGAKREHCNFAACTIVSLLRELERRGRTYAVNGSKITIVDVPISRSAAKYLARLVKAAGAEDSTQWRDLWAVRPAAVHDLLVMARQALRAEGHSFPTKLSSEEMVAALPNRVPVPKGWMRGPSGFLTEAPSRVLPELLKARELAKKPGRREHWFERHVLREMAGWLSVLTNSTVRQPSHEDGASDRRGSILEFLAIVEGVCGDESMFFQARKRSGPRFKCLGNGGILRKID